MSFLDFCFKGEKVRQKRNKSDDDDFWYKPISRFGGSSGSIDSADALTISAVYACVRVIAEGIASLPLHLYRRVEEGKEKAANLSLYKILHKTPNSYQTKFGFWEMLIGHVLLHGNAYARIYRSKRNEILSLIPLNPLRTRPIVTEDRLTYEFRSKNGEIEILPFENIFHLQGLSSDGFVGLSPLEIAARTLNYTISQETFGANFFANNATPGGIIKHPMQLEETARENLRNSIQSLHGGPENAGKVAILEEGMTWETIGFSQKDAQFLEGRQFQINEIARIFRVPPHMIGDLTRSTYSNIEQQSIDFVVNTLRPWIVRIEETIYRDLLRGEEKNNLFAEFLIDGLLRGDIQSRYNAYVQGLNNGFLSADEVRAYENLNPIPDGSGKKYRVPLNTTLSDTKDQSIK